MEKQNSNSWKVICPCHHDKMPSLSITRKNNKFLFYCHGGCDTKDILDKVGLTWSDIGSDNAKDNSWKSKLEWYYQTQAVWKDDSGKSHKGYGEGARITAVYPYRNQYGDSQYSKIRIERGSIKKKEIRYVVIDSSGETAKATNITEKYLYRLPELLETIKGGYPVYICEGEKDVENLRKVGFLGVTTPGGCSDWRKEFAPLFIGCRVIILRDNDEPGENLADQMKKDLKPYAFSIKTINPSRKPNGDVTDYFELEGGTKETLQTMIDNAVPEYAPWVNVDSKGNAKINAGLLADTIIKHLVYKIMRNPEDDRDVFLRYNGSGLYELTNKSGVKATIKKFIPSCYVSDTLLNNIYGLITADSNHVCDYNSFNEKHNLINLIDGYYNTDTWEMEKHNADILSTIQYPIRFNPDWLNRWNKSVTKRYFDDLCTDAEGLIDNSKLQVLQEFVGLLLSNIPIWKVKKCLVLWSLLGDTGKSVLISLLSSFCGVDKVKAINLSELRPDNRFVLGNLFRCRLITCGDESNTNITDSSIFKRLTGGDTVPVESKGKNAFSFVFNGGIIIACNGLPCFTDDKGGHLFERLLIVPLVNTIPEEKRDRDLLEKLLQERDLLFGWSMEGLKRLKQNNYSFTVCDAVNQTRDDYRKAMDNVYRYVCEGYVITHEYKDIISKQEFEDNYFKWCGKQNEEVKKVSKRNLPGRMQTIGVTVSIGDVNGQRRISVYRGIRRKNWDELGDFADVTKNNKSNIPF
ncbi:MAG: DUF5906 domain-containing protein [Lachnospiraceae bacterium]|nr:DUF5906 domain-containing protein [Lachnospiraceae bacterium]